MPTTIGSWGEAGAAAEVAKTASYQLLASDAGSIFTNTGAVGSVTFTLPAIAAGLGPFEVIATAAQNVLVTSTEGTNVVAPGNASASTIALQTGGDIIGGHLIFRANAAGTKWCMSKLCGNALTIT